MANPFSNIRSNAGDSQRSFQWYQQQVRTLANLDPRRLVSARADLDNIIVPGAMYMFFYDAKHKDKLPYWDKFPLVLPFRKVIDGFYGINLHYLPYMARFRLLGTLSEYTTNEKMDESTRVRASWSVLSRFSTVAPIDKCVKHYLNDHVESGFLNIKYPDWITAAMLPVERFQGATKTAVWKDTRKKK